MYREFVEERISCECESPLCDVVASSVLGSPGFVVRVAEECLSDVSDRKNIPALNSLRKRFSMGEIIFSVEADGLDDPRLERTLCLYSCQKYSGARLGEIGALFGISDAAVSRAGLRLVLKAETDQGLKKLMETLAERFGSVGS